MNYELGPDGSVRGLQNTAGIVAHHDDPQVMQQDMADGARQVRDKWVEQLKTYGPFVLSDGFVWEGAAVKGTGTVWDSIKATQPLYEGR